MQNIYTGCQDLNLCRKSCKDGLFGGVELGAGRLLYLWERVEAVLCVKLGLLARTGGF